MPAPLPHSASAQKHTHSEHANTKPEQRAKQPSRLINAAFHDVLPSSIARLTRPVGRGFRSFRPGPFALLSWD